MNLTELQKQYWKCGYCEFLIPDNLDVIVHKRFANYDEIRHDIICNESNVITMVAKGIHEDEGLSNLGADNISDVSTEQDRDEVLISAVAQRPALYDNSLPLSSIPREDVSKRWKYLRDRYCKVRRELNKYKPSGSEAVAKPPPSFKYYRFMTFLDRLKDTNDNTVTSLDPPIPVPQELSPVASTSIKKTTKRKSQPEVSALEEALIASLNQPSMDEVDGFLIRIGASLKRLPYRIRSEVEIQFLQILAEAESQINEIIS